MLYTECYLALLDRLTSTKISVMSHMCSATHILYNLPNTRHLPLCRASLASRAHERAGVNAVRLLGAVFGRLALRPDALRTLLPALLAPLLHVLCPPKCAMPHLSLCPSCVLHIVDPCPIRYMSHCYQLSA